MLNTIKSTDVDEHLMYQNEIEKVITNIEKVIDCDLSKFNFNNLYEINLFLKKPELYILDKDVINKLKALSFFITI